MLMAIAVAVVAAAFAFHHATASSPPDRQAARASLPPSPASYLGVYEAGTPGTYQPVAGFAAAADRRPNLAGYYSGWPEPSDGCSAWLRLRAAGSAITTPATSLHADEQALIDWLLYIGAMSPGGCRLTKSRAWCPFTGYGWRGPE